MSFTKFAAALALVAPLVNALTITTPTNWTSGGPAVVQWSAVNGDPQSFSIELVNPSFNKQFALSNNVPTGAMTQSFGLPVVPPGDGYSMQFVNIGNITDVFAQTGDFAIGDTVSSSTSSSSTASGSASALSSASLTGSNSASASSSGFGSTVSPSATSAASGSNSASGTQSSNTAAGSSFSSGAVALGVSHANFAGFAVMAAAALAGARLVGF